MAGINQPLVCVMQLFQFPLLSQASIAPGPMETPKERACSLLSTKAGPVVVLGYGIPKKALIWRSWDAWDPEVLDLWIKPEYVVAV